MPPTKNISLIAAYGLVNGFTGVGLASTLHVSPKQMAECWEAFSMNKKNLTMGAQLLDHCFASFRAALIQEYDNVNLNDMMDMATTDGAICTRPILKRAGTDSNSPPTSNVTPPKRLQVSFDDSARSAIVSVASNQRVSLSPAPPSAMEKGGTSSSLPKYNDRKDAGKVTHLFNPNKLEASQANAATKPTAKCTISYTCFDTNVQEPYRHMFTTLDERAKALDKHLTSLGNVMIERYGLGKEVEDEANNETCIVPLEGVGIPRQDKVCCIGRICNSVHSFLCLFCLEA